MMTVPLAVSKFPSTKTAVALSLSGVGKLNWAYSAKVSGVVVGARAITNSRSGRFWLRISAIATISGTPIFNLFPFDPGIKQTRNLASALLSDADSTRSTIKSPIAVALSRNFVGIF